MKENCNKSVAFVQVTSKVVGINQIRAVIICLIWTMVQMMTVFLIIPTFELNLFYIYLSVYFQRMLYI